MKKTTIALVYLLFFIVFSNIKAQVTIGIDRAAISGALLQLKENEGTTNNSYKGIGMPRVNLTNLAPTTATALAASMNATDSFDLDQHIGLVVYNTNQCAKNTNGVAMGSGIFVWDGTLWQSIGGLSTKYNALPIASPAETSGANTWGTSVVRHQAKTGVYEEFTSADFGTAGRWMTTNLSATAYDNSTHSTAGTASARNLMLTPDGYKLYNYNVAYWAYPNTDGLGNPLLPIEYNKNKALGLLYTWDAATAGKGGDTGRNNIYSTEGNLFSNDEVGFPEGTAASQQKRIQGICPQGWHLPSDLEWTVLENEIILNTSLYSNLPNITSPLVSELPSGTYAYRGTHGTAMKDACATSTSTNSKGNSNHAIEGGFSAPLAGNASFGSSSGFGTSAFYWTSSSSPIRGGADIAWSRGVLGVDGRVAQSRGNRGSLYSVRCKKD